MTQADVWQLLERGGFRVTRSDDSRDDEIIIEKYNGLQDPQGAQHLGHLLADVARRWSPDCVFIWEDPEDIALGFSVAVDLGVPLKRAVNAEGLAAYEGELPPGTRAVLVSDVFSDDAILLAIQGLLETRGGELIAALAVVDVGEKLAVPVESLHRLESRAGR